MVLQTTAACVSVEHQWQVLGVQGATEAFGNQDCTRKISQDECVPG